MKLRFRSKRHQARIVLTNGTEIRTERPIKLVLHGVGGGGGSGHRPAVELPTDPPDPSSGRYVEIINYF